MNRVTAGEAIALTYDVGSAGEPYEARITDALGNYLDNAVTESAPNVTVSVAADEWQNGASGWGHVEIRRADTQAVVKRDRFRIMGGLEPGYTGLRTDYGW